MNIFLNGPHMIMKYDIHFCMTNNLQPNTFKIFYKLIFLWNGTLALKVYRRY